MDTYKAELIVIGAGPAGLAAGLYGARAGLETAVFEAASPGGQALQIDALENYPGFAQPPSGFDIASSMQTQAQAAGARLVNTGVRAVSRKEGLWQADIADGRSCEAGAVILAQGARHRTLGIPGEAEFTGAGVSYCASCDGPFFKGKKIFVIGGGDAACDEARYLARLSPQVTLVHRRESLRARGEVARRVLEDGFIRKIFSAKPVEIRGSTQVRTLVLEDTRTGERHEEAADAVFIFAGIEPAPDCVACSGLEKDAAGFVVTNERLETSLSGLFAAGDIRAGAFRQVITACADGALAAHSAAEYLLRM